MPDRFSNGDPSNDKFADLKDTNCDRSNPFFRHGGDFQGIINHFDYFNELAVTALWLTPVIENNQPPTIEGGSTRTSYHGYHFTDQYQIDKRFGGNQGYKKMIEGAHAHGLKIIQDAVYNHVGNRHFLFLDPP
jgi:glycosidase